MQVVCTHATTLSGTVITPLYGIVPPPHDFTWYNRERAASGVDVSLSMIMMVIIEYNSNRIHHT